MPLPTEEQRLAAKLFGVDEEWAASHFDEWFDVFKVFDLLDTNTRILAKEIGDDHNLSYDKRQFKDWETYRKAAHWEIIALKKSLCEYLRWFPEKSQPFSYYQALAKQDASKSRKN